MIERTKAGTLFKLYVSQDEFNIAAAVVGIDLRLIGDVEEFVLKQLLLQSSEPEADTADRGCIVGY